MKYPNLVITTVSWVLVLRLMVYCAPLAAAPDVDYTPVPATVAGIWELLDKKDALLGDIVHRRDMNYVHHPAFSIRDLMRALADRIKSCPASQTRSFQAYVTATSDLAEELDRASDAPDPAGLDAAYGKLQQTLRAARADYPSDCAQKELSISQGIAHTTQFAYAYHRLAADRALDREYLMSQ